jgi:hypothetical protein
MKMGTYRTLWLKTAPWVAVICSLLLVWGIVLAADNCTRTYPNPLIKFDHKDPAGRIYFTVLNWSTYSNEMFRKAAELPPCGANTNSARTWVDIYNADTNTKIYGFCALGANTELRSLWVKPAVADKRIYIIINDRACRRSYRSNTISLTGDDCSRSIASPIIRFDRKDAEGRIYIPVVNWGAYPNDLFRQAADLPPCGANANSARTWVDIYDANTNTKIYGFCAFGSNADLKTLWFKPATPNGKVYIVLNDRACQKSYRSNTIAYGECAKTYPNPVIKFDRKDAEGRIYIPVTNWTAYLNELFRPAPELPPCGANTNSARTWVDIYDANTNTKIYGFCALNSNAGLKDLWFKPAAPNGRVYIILTDRACQKSYRSNIIAYGPCAQTFPNPIIRFDRKDAEGRIYIPVINWGAYTNELFRQAPELPPCGANANSARTWVDIYDANTNIKIYGFCALGSNADLQSIWFKPTTPSGRVYIVFTDRACQKSYRSNIITWQ